MSETTRPEAQRRVTQALQHIQRAQEEASRAQTLLASLVGAAPECERVAELYDRVRATWYVVAKLRGAQLDLDEMAAKAIEQAQRR